MRISKEVIPLLTEIPKANDESESETESAYVSTVDKDSFKYACLTSVQKTMAINFEKRIQNYLSII